MVNKIITMVFVFILAVGITGCLNGDISTAIEKWNKVADKIQEIQLFDEQFEKTISNDNILIDAEVAKATPNFEKIFPILDKWQETLTQYRNLLDEESSLISDFAGATVNLDGDAKIYGDNILKNIRDSHKYGTSSIDNLNRGIESLKTCLKTSDETSCSQSEQYFKAAESDVAKSEIYTNSANDNLKKLEALQ